MSIEVLRAGALVTVQDLGRRGLQHTGVVTGGAMDPIAHRVANALVGNGPDVATIEIALSGPELRFSCDALVALHGARYSAEIDHVRLPQSRPVLVRAGTRMQIGHAEAGCFAYLAVAGGLAVEPVLGSRSTYLAGGFGGCAGRSLTRGAEIPFAPDAEARAARRFARISTRHRVMSVARCGTVRWFAPAVTVSEGKECTVRAVEGIHAALFDEAARGMFFAERWRVAPDSNRMGFRLLGPKLALGAPTEILSHGTCLGTVQVPPAGQPIVLMADHQTTGGYPRIAEVIAADAPMLAQARPGMFVRFVAVTIEEADAAREMLNDRVEKLVQRIRWEFGDEAD